MKLTSTLDDVELFTIVVAVGSFSEAARKIGLTASSVARRMNELELELGVALLTRTTRRMSLTDAGSLFYERALRVTSELAEAKAVVSGLDVEPRGRLRVSAPISFGSRHVAPAVADLIARFADLSIDLSLNDTHIDLVKTGIDVAIRLGRLPDSSLMASKLAPARRVVVGSPAYFSSHGIPQSPEELADHDCLVMQNCPARSWHFVKADREARAYHVSGRVTSDSAEALLASALAGVGLAHLPTWLVHEQIRVGHLIAVLRNFDGGESVHGGIYAVRPASRTPSAKVRELVNLLRERFGQPPFWDQVHETPLQEVSVGHLRLVT